MRYVGAVLLVLSLGCSDADSPVRPTPPATLPPDSPTLEYRLSGRVVDTAYRPLADASVEVVNGSRVGTIATTDQAGRFSMPGLFTGATTVRASKEGYVSDTNTFPFRGALPPSVEAVEMQLYLQPLGASADMAGVYTLTLTADRACTNLPAELRTRTYTATVAPGRSSYFVGTLSGARFFSMVPCPPGQPPETCTFNSFGIGIAGDYASLFLGFIEQPTETTYLVLSAGASGSVGPTGITAPLHGYFLLCSSEPVQIDQGEWVCQASAADRGVLCDSDHHQLTLIRR